MKLTIVIKTLSFCFLFFSSATLASANFVYLPDTVTSFAVRTAAQPWTLFNNAQVLSGGVIDPYSLIFTPLNLAVIPVPIDPSIQQAVNFSNSQSFVTMLDVVQLGVLTGSMLVLFFTAFGIGATIKMLNVR